VGEKISILIWCYAAPWRFLLKTQPTARDKRLKRVYQKEKLLPKNGQELSAEPAFLKGNSIPHFLSWKYTRISAYGVR